MGESHIKYRNKQNLKQIYKQREEQNADLCEDPHRENYHPRG